MSDDERGDLTEMFGLIDALFNESDRGMVLVCQSKLDAAFEELLRQQFISTGTPRGEIDWLLTKKPVPPLQSLHIKVSVARAFGLIDPATCRTSKLLNSLRNDAAHSDSSFQLTEEAVSPIVCSFEGEIPKTIIARTEKFMRWHNSLPSEIGAYSTKRHTPARLLFENCVWEIHRIIHDKTRQVAGLPELEVSAGEIVQLFTAWKSKNPNGVWDAQTDG